MESETLTREYRQPSMLQRVLSASVPMLLIAVGYVDPGKWAAMVDGGARFGFDLVMLVLLFNFAAILCQYLSACIALVTDRDLAQICSEEYDKVTCIFLGIQAEVSMIALDLTMVLGTAHGLNVVFGVDLFSCVFLTATGAILFPLLASLFDNGSAKFLCIGWASSVLLSYVFGVVITLPETPFSIGGVLNKFSGESAFALMSLLGASIMPHNFYLHSSIVQQGKESTELSRGALCQDHFFAIVFIFSGIFLVNYAAMNSAANVSYSTGLLLLTFQDTLSLLDQVFRSSVAPFTIMLVTFISNQVTPLTWDLGRQAVVHDLFGMDIPGWLHHVTIRVISIVPALYCVWSSGAEGLYQLLILTQVVVALVLPSSVIPLFRVASSRSIMGIHKISQLMEFLSLGTFIGLLGLKIIFVIEMIFGNSDWVNNLKWNIGSSVSTPYVFLLIAASLCLCLMLWLAVTPLKSASSRFDAQAFLQTHVPEPYSECNQLGASNAMFGLVEGSSQKQEGAFHVEKSLVSHPDLSTKDPDQLLPESLLDFEKVHHLATIDESKSETTFSAPAVVHPEVPVSAGTSPSVKSVCNEVSGVVSVDTSVFNTESVDVAEKTLRIEGDMANDRDDGDLWEEPEEAIKGVSENAQSFISDGPGSYKSLSGKLEDTGSGTGSLSRLAGLGRAARRQLTEALNEFWGQLFDYHGMATAEAKSKKLDIILGLDSKMNPKPAPASLKVESSAYIPSGSARIPEPLINSHVYSPKQQFVSNIVDSAYRVPKEPSSTSSMWSNHMKLVGAYVQSSNSNMLDSGERRYSSMRIPATSAGYDQQPATVHGYQITAYITIPTPPSQLQNLFGFKLKTLQQTKKKKFNPRPLIKNFAMAQKHLHELLQEDQEPFKLKHYIADRRCQLNKNPSKYSLQTVKKQKSISSPSNTSTLLCKHACFFTSIRKKSDGGSSERLSPINFPASTKSPVRKVFLHIPASTSSLLLESAMRIQKKQKNRPKLKKTQMGFGLFGSILKKFMNKKREIGMKRNEIVAELTSGSCSCNHSRLSSAGWSESNEEKSMDFETSSSCRSENEEIEDIELGICENKYCSSPISPFRFSLQKCPSSTGCRTPDFSSPVASPVRHKTEDKENYEDLANIEQEEDEKEQCSPVSVLDPPFDDDGHEREYEDEDEDEEYDDCGIECNYALVQRAQQQLLSKLRRFEKLAELDPIELEKLMLEEEEEEGNNDLEYDNDSLLSYRDRDFETFASEVTIPFDMKRLVSDLIYEEKTETNNSNNREEEVVFGRVCKRLDSWQHVRSDTIDMMIESDFKTELDDWKKFHEQREEAALEVEVSIFRLLVEELAEEIVHFGGHHW